MKTRSSVQVMVFGCLFGLLACVNRDGYTYVNVSLSQIELAPSFKDFDHRVEARLQNPIVNDTHQIIGYLLLFSSPIEVMGEKTERKVESAFICQAEPLMENKNRHRHNDLCHIFIRDKRILGIKWISE